MLSVAWLPARWASGDHQQNHQCLWFPNFYNVTHVFCPSFFCILLGIKLLLTYPAKWTSLCSLCHTWMIHYGLSTSLIRIKAARHGCMLTNKHCQHSAWISAYFSSRAMANYTNPEEVWPVCIRYLVAIIWIRGGIVNTESAMYDTIPTDNFMENSASLVEIQKCTTWWK